MAHKSLEQQEAERKQKGRELAERGHVVTLGNGWSVLGQSHKVYFLTFQYDAPALFACTCEDYARNGHLFSCKHGHAVEYYRKAEAARIRARYSLPALVEVEA